MATNLDIFKDIETMMNEAESEMKVYLKVLSERKDYMTEYRQEYRKLNDAINSVKNSIKKELSNNEERHNIIKRIIKDIDVQINAVQQEEEYYTDGSQDKIIKSLNAAKARLDKTQVKTEDIEEANIYLNKSGVNIKGLADVENHQISTEKLNQILKLINLTESDYLSSFKTYKQACEHSDEAFDAFDDVVGVLLEYRFADEANELINALPNIEDTRKQRPSAEPLLDILIPIKSNGLQYWKSNNKNSFAYDYNIAFAKEIAYTRRALLEEREYKGTESAFNRLNKAYENLKNYMYERYHQLGGTPYNYHGHEGR